MVWTGILVWIVPQTFLGRISSEFVRTTNPRGRVGKVAEFQRS